ncbi:MAG: branched-chain amino acid transaminase [Planctomycetota bacterium]|jgi:branched-chain amino acid aminotransferase
MSGRLQEAEWIWHDGEWLRWQEAQVHLLSLAVQFGSSIFEGMRCYKTPEGPAIFRLDEHMRRLEDSCAIYRMEVPYSREQLHAACKETVRKNGLEDCYIRPVVLRGYGSAGMLPDNSPIEVYIAAWPWGTYLGEEALREGVDVCVASWNRPAPNTFPVMAKSAGHYNNAQLIKMEAVAHGYVEAIALGPDGLVSEGSGQNLFLVRDGELITPPIDGTLLHGITRSAIIQLAEEAGLKVREETVAREMLYIADELFFTGTATELAPIRSVDRIPIGTGRAGEISLDLQKRFMAYVHGEVPDVHGWRSLVEDSNS